MSFHADSDQSFHWAHMSFCGLWYAVVYHALESLLTEKLTIFFLLAKFCDKTETASSNKIL